MTASLAGRVYYWPPAGHLPARPATEAEVAEFGDRAHGASTCGDYQCGRLHWTIAAAPATEIDAE